MRIGLYLAARKVVELHLSRNCATRVEGEAVPPEEEYPCTPHWRVADRIQMKRNTRICVIAHEMPYVKPNRLFRCSGHKVARCVFRLFVESLHADFGMM